MSYLTVGDYLTVPVAIGSPRVREEVIGDVRRAFSGVPRSSVRGYFRVWEGVETTWMTRSDGDALVDELQSEVPLTVGGDMVGAVESALVLNIQRIETARAMVDGLNTEMVRIGFDLWGIA